MSSPHRQKNTYFPYAVASFSCACNSIFQCGYPHRNFSYPHNFSVGGGPTEKLFLDSELIEKIDFSIIIFFVGFSDGTPSQKYFSVHRLFLWVFTHTEVFEFPIV